MKFDGRPISDIACDEAASVCAGADLLFISLDLTFIPDNLTGRQTDRCYSSRLSDALLYVISTSYVLRLSSRPEQALMTLGSAVSCPGRATAKVVASSFRALRAG